MEIELKIKAESLEELKEILELKKKVQVEPQAQVDETVVDFEEPIITLSPPPKEMTEPEPKPQKIDRQNKRYTRRDAKIVFEEFSNRNFELRSKDVYDIADKLGRSVIGIKAMIRDLNYHIIGNEYLSSEHKRHGQRPISIKGFVKRRKITSKKNRKHVMDWKNITSITPEKYHQLENLVDFMMKEYGVIKNKDVVNFSRENNLQHGNVQSWCYIIRKNWLIDNEKPDKKIISKKPQKQKRTSLTSRQDDKLQKIVYHAMENDGCVAGKLISKFADEEGLTRTKASYYAYSKFRKEWIEKHGEPDNQGYMTKDKPLLPKAQPQYITVKQKPQQEEVVADEGLSLADKLYQQIKKTILNPIDNKGQIVIDKMLVETIGDVEFSENEYRDFLSKLLMKITKEGIAGMKGISSFDNKIYIKF